MCQRDFSPTVRGLVPDVTLFRVGPRCRPVARLCLYLLGATIITKVQTFQLLYNTILKTFYNNFSKELK